MYGLQHMLRVLLANVEKLVQRIGVIKVRINNGTFGYGCL
jgi:hypothetical protein